MMRWEVGSVGPGRQRQVWVQINPQGWQREEREPHTPDPAFRRLLKRKAKASAENKEAEMGQRARGGGQGSGGRRNAPEQVTKMPGRCDSQAHVASSPAACV